MEKKTSLRRSEGGYVAVYPRLLKSASLIRCNVGPPRCYKALRRSVESLATAYLRLLLHFFVSSLFQVFSSIIQLPFLLLYRRVLLNIIVWGIREILLNMNVNHTIRL